MTESAARARRRILLVGEDFGRSGAQYRSDRYALTGRSGERVAALAGLEFPLGYVRVFDRLNVVSVPSDWDDAQAVALGVARLVPIMLGYPRVILLGRRVAAAFAVLDHDVLEWRLWRVRVDDVIVAPGVQVARVPHPSGRNRWWNSQVNTERAQSFLKEAVEWVRSELG